jgi:hypothetical protein
MRRDQVSELHYITPVSNVVSICQRGILCNRLSQKHSRESVAMAEMQARRAVKVVPSGQGLHEYANLYLHARNPMLFKRKEQHANLCVLRVNHRVLDLPNAVITSQNAASGYARFYPSPNGLEHLDYNEVYAEYWTHPGDPIAEWRHKSIKCAEVLVPGQIGVEYLMGAYVSNPITKSALEAQLEAEGITLDVTINAHLFFVGGRP